MGTANNRRFKTILLDGAGTPVIILPPGDVGDFSAPMRKQSGSVDVVERGQIVETIHGDDEALTLTFTLNRRVGALTSNAAVVWDDILHQRGYALSDLVSTNPAGTDGPLQLTLRRLMQDAAAAEGWRYVEYLRVELTATESESPSSPVKQSISATYRATAAGNLTDLEVTAYTSAGVFA